MRQGTVQKKKGRILRINGRIVGGGFVLIVLLLLLSSCADIGYLAQCARGHLGVMSSCEPIAGLIDDPGTRPELKGKLEQVVRIRDFASRELGLPDNDSYRSYGDLGRPYVVWNIVAAPEFSLTPKEWCFPVAGCISYRGYYDRNAAEAYADRLSREGNDVHLYGVRAYSTLNWFDDPVLNTFLTQGEPHLAGTIFHELAHQVLYVKGDSRFNEAFATTVEIEGVKRWLSRSGNLSRLTAYRKRYQRHDAFLALVGEVREELAALYRSGLPAEEMRRSKEAIFEDARRRHEEFRSVWKYAGYEGFFADLSNARIASVSTYRDLVPAFQLLLAEADHHLPTFFSATAELARLPAAERHARLGHAVRLAEISTETDAGEPL